MVVHEIDNFKNFDIIILPLFQTVIPLVQVILNTFFLYEYYSTVGYVIDSQFTFKRIT